MSVQDLKREIEASSEEDKLFLLAFLQHIIRREDPAYKKLLAERVKEMQAGNKVSLSQVKRLHEALEAEGL